MNITKEVGLSGCYDLTNDCGRINVFIDGDEVKIVMTPQMLVYLISTDKVEEKVHIGMWLKECKAV